MKADVAILGGGLAGLTAAIGALRAGARTTLVSTGMGVLNLSSGCIDLMAYPGGLGRTPVESPLETIRAMRADFPDHPYARISDSDLPRYLAAFIDACERQGHRMIGDGSVNFRIATALGTGRPTAIAPFTMAGGDLRDKKPVTIVGFTGLRDFSATLAAGGMASEFGIDAATAHFDPTPFMEGAVNAVSLGRAFENPRFGEHLALFLEAMVKPDRRIGLPAVLGSDHAAAAHELLAERTGRVVFEIPILPPSLPGRRIHQALKRELFELGGQFVSGCPVLGARIEAGRVVSVTYKTGETGRRSVSVGACVLATGSFFSGGLTCERGAIKEPVFGLPVRDEPPVGGRYRPEFLDERGHPLGKAGVRAGRDLMPCDADGAPIASNLFAAGDVIGGFDSLVERSGGGVAIASGFFAGESAARAAGR